MTYQLEIFSGDISDDKTDYGSHIINKGNFGQFNKSIAELDYIF
jgi:hypothetical protein